MSVYNAKGPASSADTRCGIGYRATVPRDIALRGDKRDPEMQQEGKKMDGCRIVAAFAVGFEVLSPSGSFQRQRQSQGQV